MKIDQKIILFIHLLFIMGCTNTYTPKPRGFFRIDFPEKQYHNYSPDNSPYSFDVPDYSKTSADKDNNAGPFDINISFTENKSDIHITYKTIDTPGINQSLKNSFLSLTEDSRSFAYKHSVKADAIEERLYINPQKKVYGTIYLIDGNAASPIQFYLTDSTKHFLRGALYIREIPNRDSLKPVIDFLRPDVIRLIESTSWK